MSQLIFLGAILMKIAKMSLIVSSCLSVCPHLSLPTQKPPKGFDSAEVLQFFFPKDDNFVKIGHKKNYA
jgi:hypothetical protein